MLLSSIYPNLCYKACDLILAATTRWIMLRAFKNLLLGSDDNEPTKIEAPKLVTDADFRKAQDLSTLVLLTLPHKKLSYCLTEGEFQGKSYLWLFGNGVMEGRVGPYMTVCLHLTQEALCAKPLCGKTLLWMLAYAAFIGRPTGPLMDALRKFGAKLTTDDLDVEVDGSKVRDLLITLSVNNPKIGNLVPGLISDINCPDDDSCNSAGTLVDDDNSHEQSEGSCHSAGTINNDDDGDATPPSYKPYAQLRMHSRTASASRISDTRPLNTSGGHSPGSQSPRIRAWKIRQSQINADNQIRASETSSDTTSLSTQVKKSEKPR